ncbi:MAG: DNA gyrase subunit A [Candidatus Lokiarchaeota archaeon]|nr:DNA gyrase subunit A [Candidatus Lokiarchaeota archaeon]
MAADKKTAGDIAVQNPANIIGKGIKDEIETAYLNYSMSVIVGRALPDIRDGLKPVHRRILFSMHEMGLRHNTAHKKSARIVGDVIGKYHPHGDLAVYDALVRMAQDFSLRHPLIDGQGNFGSVDGDPPAAYRYTEARMSEMAQELLADLDKETVPFDPNYDETLTEPHYLPARIPNLLVNGAQGIAVGMSTSIPTYNLGEILDAVVALIDKDLSLSELIKIIPGPDFPTGATIIGQKGIAEAYRIGKGSIVIRAKADIETDEDRQAIIVTEIPYMVNKANLIEDIDGKIKEGTIADVNHVRDESDREGMRIVFELSKKANPKTVLNNLYKHSRLQTSFHVMNLVLVDGIPKILGMKEMLLNFIAHREDIILKRTTFEKRKAEERIHVVDGLLKALDNIDAVIKIIKESQSSDKAREELVGKFQFSEIQANEILDMRLRRLTGLERQKLVDEQQQLLVDIDRYKAILASKDERMKVIKEECAQIKEKYKKSIARKSTIELSEEEIVDIPPEDLIKEEDVAVILTKTGYIKRIPVSLYETQNRGGKGKRAASLKSEDVIKDVFIASTHDYLLVLTNMGRLYWLRVYDIPEGSRESKGKPIEAFISLKPEERISTIVQTRDFSEDFYLIIATKHGIIKKSTLDQFSNIREPGVIAITLRENDEIVAAKITSGDHEIVLGTKHGMANRFAESEVRPTGRGTMGVKGMNLREGDHVIGMVTVEEDATMTLLTVTKKGYGKRTRFDDYRLTHRGSLGVKNIDTKLRGDEVMCIKCVSESDELMLASKKGNMVRLAARDIKVLGRAAAGYIIMRFKDEEDELVAIDLVVGSGLGDAGDGNDAGDPGEAR